jgi:hypothetical protein
MTASGRLKVYRPHSSAMLPQPARTIRYFFMESSLPFLHPS